MKILFALFLIPLSTHCFSQTYLPNYYFRSQNQIDSFKIKFPDCKYVDYIQVLDTSNTIVDLTPLKQINKVKTIWVLDNPKLSKIDLFNEIETDSVSEFLIANNPLLDTVILFNKSKICINGFEINNDRPLYMELFSEVDSSFFFQIRLPKDGISELKGFDKARSFHSATFSGSINLPLFKNLKNASLTIGSSNILSDMSNFSALETIGTLRVTDIGIPFNLQGLEELKKIRTLSLTFIDSLYSFNTLDDIKDLSNLTINGIKGNINLVELKYPNSLKQISLTAINGNLDFSGVTFDSLNRLMIINTELEECNFNLTNVAKKFSKYNNSDPQSTYYKYRGNSLIIANNPNLDYCNSKAICDLVKAIPENEIAIENNGTNCNTVEEVKAACIVNTSDTESDNVYVYPNPFNNDFHIQCDNCKDDYKINIYDILGRKVNTDYSLSNSNYYIYASEWDKGYYFLKLSDKNNDGEIVKPLIKF